MPELLTGDRLSDIREEIERAHREIGEVAAQGPSRRFRMTIPSRPGWDTDLVISDALKGAEDLLGEVDRLNAEKARLREKAERRLLKLADIESAYRKMGDQAGVARQDYAAAEIRSLFGIEWKPGGEPRD